MGDASRKPIALGVVIGLVIGACAQFFAGATAHAQAAATAVPTDRVYSNRTLLYDPHAFEVRAGFQVEARPDSNEAGTVGVGGDLVFPRFFTLNSLPDLFTPRFQVGGIVNTAGRTDFAHADLLWTANFTDRIFSEFFLGVTVHDGHLLHDSNEFNALGCRALFHVGGDLGYRFAPRWSAMLVLDHSSAGTGATNCPANQSLNQVGLKIGYQF